MSSAELSRGRGGPRCMSMPLVREDLDTSYNDKTKVMKIFILLRVKM